MPRIRTIHVGLGPRSYDIIIGADILPSLGARTADVLNHTDNHKTTRRAFVIHDTGLPATAPAAAIRSLSEAHYTTTSAPLEPSEPHKSLQTAETLLAALARSRHERTDPVIALGGGIVGDLAGFVAATYRRGVPVIQCPTTLLAMVDASVGGKTGVNLSTGQALLKNAVGAFHQPSLVLCDVSLLQTLPREELACGLAECIKHALLAADWGDPDLLTWLSASLDAILALDEAHLVELVARNVAIKAAVVGLDEREENPAAPGGGRLALNMGHSVAHAIETLMNLRHGHAVALGLIAESACGEALGATLRGTTDHLRTLLTRAGLPTALPNPADPETIYNRLLDDKKTRAGQLRVPLPTGDGHCRLIVDPPREAVVAGIRQLVRFSGAM